ncbi:AGE family epimerase/isomerase, partial [Acetobacter tropicalis]
FAYDGIGRDGTVLKASSRLWVQGEALRGVLTVNPQDTADHLAARMADTLLTRYFTGCPEGTWLDQLDAAGQPAVTAIPTSSLYHIVTAFEALDQAASRL